jgi:hypothetical protein
VAVIEVVPLGIETLTVDCVHERAVVLPDVVELENLMVIEPLVPATPSPPDAPPPVVVVTPVALDVV